MTGPTTASGTGPPTDPAAGSAEGPPGGPTGEPLGESTDRKRRFAVAILAVFGVLSVLSTDDGPVLCPLRRCSGGYCPACGLTRSGGRLLRGDLAASWAEHPYLLIAIGQIAAVAGLWASGSAAVRRRLGLIVRPALMVNVGIMATIWVFRMVDGSIPVPFFG